MARSTRIYLASEENSGVRAAFTVRHELATWLSENEGEYKLYTISDGGHGDRPEPYSLPTDKEEKS